jgi:branched-chain amino acid transport system ATP-binding protein
MAITLSCRNVSLSYGAFRALHNVSLEFEHGQTCAIIGPNGAGKTTFLNVLSGLLKPSNGVVMLNDHDITHLPPERRAKLGLGRSFQIAKIFLEMTVRENLRLGAQRKYYGMPPFWIPAGHNPVVERAVEKTLHNIGMEDRADVEAAQLSHGSQRVLELGLTLVTQPDVILLDEPLAGIGHHDLPQMIKLIKAISRNKTTILIEHNMDAVMEIAIEIVVLVSGELLARGEPAAVQSNPAVRKAYLGN